MHLQQSRSNLIPLLGVVLVYVALLCLTTPAFISDTTVYAADAVAYADGTGPTRLWEFGHLLWRPWGYVGLRVAGGMFQSQYQDDAKETVARFLILTNIACGLICVVLFFRIARHMAGSWSAVLATVGFMSVNPMVNYCQSGSSYVPGLAAQLGSLCLVSAAVESRRGVLLSGLGGVLFAVSCALWFPYALTGLGVLALFAVWPMRSDSSPVSLPRQRMRLAGVFLGALAVTAAGLFICGAIGAGVRTVGEFRLWVSESSHGWSQTLNIVRMATGWARGFYDLSQDSICLKRIFFHDPYNACGLAEVSGSLGGKLVLCYAATLALLAGIARPFRKSLGIILLCGMGPLIAFAILLLEPSSPERFLPGFPFLFLCIAILLDRQTGWLVSKTLLVVMVTLPLVNTWQLRSSSSQYYDDTLRRKELLDQSIQKPAAVFLLILQDEFVALPNTRPLDRRLKANRFIYRTIITLASSQSAHWKGDFAQEAFAQWKLGREVWISQRGLAARPEPLWHWVEGDDRNVHWGDLPAFFGRLEYEKETAGPDGFSRLAPSPRNMQLLEELASPLRQ